MTTFIPTSDPRHYWAFQAAGWSALALLSFLSLTLWYNPGQWVPAAHTALQSVLGLIVSHPMRWVASAAWTARPLPRVMVNGAAIVIASIAWTALRLGTFTWLTGEPIPPSDWGGWIFASVVVLGAWAFCYHAIKYYRQWNEQRHLIVEAQKSALEAQARVQQENVRRLEAEASFQDAQLRMLRYQINPHFLFNALNSVSSLVQKGDAYGATRMLARIGEFLRATLEWDGDVMNSLEAEIEIIQSYLDIELVRFGSRLHTEFDVSSEALSVNVPTLLLQPLFENAIKFAVGKSLEQTTIRLRGWVEDGRLELRVSDTGPGLRAGVQAGIQVGAHDGVGDSVTSTGLGLKNVAQRLRSTYGDEGRIRLAAGTPKGLTVEISIPAQSMVVRRVERADQLQAEAVARDV